MNNVRLWGGNTSHYNFHVQGNTQNADPPRYKVDYKLLIPPDNMFLNSAHKRLIKMWLLSIV